MANVIPSTPKISDPGLCDVSIIIPIGPGDDSWQNLIADLTQLPFSAEILLVASNDQLDRPREIAPVTAESLNKSRPSRIEWLRAPVGRAHQMNFGATRATGRFLWFLHADSRIDDKGLDALQCGFVTAPAALHFFHLAFQGDGPRWMGLNAWGVWIRSCLFGMPFGDQGFCLARETFRMLGGFSETASYGEDHLFVWMAKRRRIRLRCTGATLHTSARKYQEQGWARTTWRHVRLTYIQAWPQFWLWFIGR